jgi:hypothetical protein
MVWNLLGRCPQEKGDSIAQGSIAATQFSTPVGQPDTVDDRNRQHGVTEREHLHVGNLS